MIRIYLSLSLVLSVLFSNAQSSEEFQQAGKDLFTQLTDPSKEQFVPYLRSKQYMTLIDSQDWDEEKKIKRKKQINESYSPLYLQWQESIELHQSNYRDAKGNGATFKYIGTRYYEDKSLKDTYNVETSFLFSTSSMQSEVILTYQLAWLPDLGLRLMSTITEGF